MRIYPGFLLGTALMACGSMACGPDIQGYCEAAEECRGGNDADIEACVATSEYEQDVADIEGCTAEFNDLADCTLDASSCQTQDTGNACMTSNDCNGGDVCSGGTCKDKSYGLKDQNACEAESNAYQSCR